MIWCDLKENGDLLLRPTDELEAFALTMWEKQRKAGKAKLVIDTRERLTLQQVADVMGKEYKEFEAWRKAQAEKIVVIDSDQDAKADS